jgi:hypothetical protein
MVNRSLVTEARGLLAAGGLDLGEQAMKGIMCDVEYQPLGSSPAMRLWLITTPWAGNSLVCTV